MANMPISKPPLAMANVLNDNSIEIFPEHSSTVPNIRRQSPLVDHNQQERHNKVSNFIPFVTSKEDKCGVCKEERRECLIEKDGERCKPCRLKGRKCSLIGKRAGDIRVKSEKCDACKKDRRICVVVMAGERCVYCESRGCRCTLIEERTPKGKLSRDKKRVLSDAQSV
ncbi:hypothetical protein BT63DRAFT_27800 [Microthyrium microscopicum]|uniref:Zn(2)-C6 fungal-type domain-containing protein n=1 Tax=Microthyrium microscopicum TaxID=703497 RepID=A0A6A6US00_9PEZI|nr:hypothetical protein BT63DRAFT_27800 [Microthyrium microscopicum]